MFRLCFVWVYIIKGYFPLGLSLQASAGFVKRIFLRLQDSFLRLPKVVLHKGKQNGLFRVLLSYNFLRQCAVLSLSNSGRLEMTDQRFKQARQRSKTGLAIGLFCGTNFQVLRSYNFIFGYLIRARQKRFKRVLIRTDFLSLQVGGIFISGFFAPFFNEELL